MLLLLKKYLLLEFEFQLFLGHVLLLVIVDGILLLVHHRLIHLVLLLVHFIDLVGLFYHHCLLILRHLCPHQTVLAQNSLLVALFFRHHLHYWVRLLDHWVCSRKLPILKVQTSRLVRDHFMSDHVFYVSHFIKWLTLLIWILCYNFDVILLGMFDYWDFRFFLLFWLIRWRRVLNYHLLVVIELPLENLHHLLLPLNNVNVGVFQRRLLLLRSGNVVQNLILLKLSGRTHLVPIVGTLGQTSVEVELHQQFWTLFHFFFRFAGAARRAAGLSLPLLPFCT